MLRYLDAFGPMSQQQLADGIRVDSGNLIATLDELQAAELIRREVDPADRRRRELALTARGRCRLRDGIAAAERADDELLAALTQAERASLRATAIRVYEHLRAEG